MTDRLTRAREIVRTTPNYKGMLASTPDRKASATRRVAAVVLREERRAADRERMMTALRRLDERRAA